MAEAPQEILQTKRLNEELTKRADATVKDALEINKSADVLKLANSIDNELAKDAGEFHKLQGELGKAMKDQRGDAFGIFTNTVEKTAEQLMERVAT